jgi:hypothetical protein
MLHISVEEASKAIVDPFTLKDIVKIVHHAPSAFPSERLGPCQERIDRPLLEEPIPPHVLQP